MTFGEKLFDLRKSRKLSQDELAEKLCVTRQAVSKWELGETLPDSENVIKLADMFYVSAEYLLNDDVTEQPQKTLPTFANKYDAVNLLGALASLGCAICAVFHYGLRMYYEITSSYNLPPRDNSIRVYFERVYYEILDETVILVFLAAVIIISAIIAIRIYKKCDFQNKLNKNSK